MEWYWAALFFLSSFFNFRAAFKLLVDWKGMLTTCRFVEDAYERLESLPDEAALDRSPRAPLFVHLVPAYQEPEIAAPGGGHQGGGGPGPPSRHGVLDRGADPTPAGGASPLPAEDALPARHAG
jgi:hypothetical protein